MGGRGGPDNTALEPSGRNNSGKGLRALCSGKGDKTVRAEDGDQEGGRAKDGGGAEELSQDSTNCP